MLGPIFILNLIALFLWPASCEDATFFVHPAAQRGPAATGSFFDPFDNLLLAINAARDYDFTTIYLQYGDNKPHYVFFKETNHPSYTGSKDMRDYDWFKYENSNWNTIVQMKNINIRPYYCDQLLDKTYQNETYCTWWGNRPTISIKAPDLRFSVSGVVRIEDVIFDGLEAINQWNPKNEFLPRCLNWRGSCCREGETRSSQVDFIQCLPDYHDYSQLNLNVNSGLFILDQKVPNRASLTFNFVDFKNFVQPQLKSLIQTGENPFDLLLWHVTTSEIFFDRGIIWHAGNSLSSNDSFITLDGSNFMNYNHLNLLKPNSNRREGYLIYSEYIFSGVIKMMGSTFKKMTTSVRDKCWLQTKDFYNAPLNNFILGEPRSRSDIWAQYHQDHRIGRQLMSSLIYLYCIDGAISIQGSTFENIIGTSGSVLHVDEARNSKTWITIYDSTFDNNFAYDGFANILVAKSYDGDFSRMLSCPHIEIVNSMFTNSYGCPGSYGNVALICYWDLNPPDKTTLSSYQPGGSALSDFNAPSDGKTNLTDFFLAQEEKYAYIRVKKSVFENNQLSLSNSLAVVGGYFTVLENNTFQHNTGNYRDSISSRLSGSYFISRHPEQFPSNFYYHFGQSTAVYFDRVVKIFSKNNIFNNNYGPWEGSMALA